jgi:tRNA threonylcarbamoyladenosine biosynthesis protein TsaB
VKILALELSTTLGSLAWLDDRFHHGSSVNGATAAGDFDPPFASNWQNDRRNSGSFFENLQMAIKQFGLPEIIVVGLGPGSYAGTRIAISVAIGLQAAARARLIGFPSVCAIEGIDDYAIVGDARRSSFYYARIRERRLVEDFQLFREDELHDKINQLDSGVRIISSDLLPQFKRLEQRFPSAMILAELGCSEEPGFRVPPLEPIYLREPHVTIPKPILQNSP